MALATQLHRFFAGTLAAAILSFGFSASLCAQIPDSERQALIDIYNSTDGPHWTNNTGWLGPVGTEGTWWGVTVYLDHVTSLDLSDNNLSGHVPSLSALTAINGIGFRFNRLTGSLPDLTGMQQLEGVSFGHNQFVGTIPDLLDLPNLQGYAAEANHLTGPLPEIAGLPNLSSLMLYGNILKGELPASYQSLPSLNEPDLTYNALTVPAPPPGGVTHNNFTTQTVAPLGVTAAPGSSSSVVLQWTPIVYQSESGRYEVLASRNPGGPYSVVGATSSKSESHLLVGNLDPVTTYYFAVRTVTDPHGYTVPLQWGDNPNTVVSDPSAEVSATTLGALGASFEFAPSDPIAGQAVDFTSTSTGSPTAFTWDFGDPGSGDLNFATRPGASHVYFQPGSYFVTLTVQTASELQEVTHAVVVGSVPGGCTPSATALCLSAGRFQVSVEWSAEHLGTHGAGTAVPVASDTGNFWFFSPDAVELVVKIVDGRAVNGKFWVFYGALSNVAYTITITDTQTGAAKTYVNPQDALASVSDTSAFSDSGGSSSTVLSTQPAPSKTVNRTIPASAPQAVAPSSPCVADETTLCLKDGRFKVRVAWRALHLGTSGSGHALTLSPDTGNFWFFGSNSIELVVKVVDGNAVNGKFWVFYGALTNVEYTISVTDAETGVEKTYFNPQDSQASVADTSAF